MNVSPIRAVIMSIAERQIVLTLFQSIWISRSKNSSYGLAEAVLHVPLRCRVHSFFLHQAHKSSFASQNLSNLERRVIFILSNNLVQSSMTNWLGGDVLFPTREASE